jgi:hypothetical protein
MMHLACWLLFLTSAYPLSCLWRASRRSSLVQVAHWALITWAAWGAATVVSAWPAFDGQVARYLALCLTGCVGVAVLGARRPGVGSWNFVVLGLLAVLLLPLFEGLEQMGGVRLVFLGGVLAVGVLNYLPTRLGTAAALFGIAVGVEFLMLAVPPDRRGGLEPVVAPSRCLLAVVPWLALGWWRHRRRPASEFDRLWLRFRDRFGAVWALRVREQFNRSAAHAGWPVQLTWWGLWLDPAAGPADEGAQAAMLDTLQALLKRFGP